MQVKSPCSSGRCLAGLHWFTVGGGGGGGEVTSLCVGSELCGL